MIEYIDIPNFGSFKNFVWRTSIRDSGNNVAKFKKLNIIYGRNYSGKTTLSRIFGSLQTGDLPDTYENPTFSVSTDSCTITQSQIPTDDYHIRVYNGDFIDNHLSFLRDREGKITPFAIIGSENKAIKKEIAEKEKELGNVEEQTGLRYKHATQNAEFLAKQDVKNEVEKSLKAKLTHKATQPPAGIKHNPIYKDPNYNTPKIQTDIETIRKQSFEILEDRGRKEKEALLNETELPDIEKKLVFNAPISNLRSTAKDLLSKKSMPTEPIQELLDDAVLQAWVKEGIPHHRNKRNKCGFCGQTLPADLWKKLDEHFSKESAELEAALQNHIEFIEKERKSVDAIVTVESKDFYSTFQASFEEAKKAIDDEVSKYGAALDNIIKSLRARAADIFTPKSIPELTDNSTEIAAKIAVVNGIIDQNNTKTASLAEDQQKAREELRLSEIAQFIQDIDLSGEEKKVAALQKEADDLETEVQKLHTKIQAVEEEIENLRILLKDEKKGAEKVNEYLNHYFGHEGLRLEAVEDTETSSFKFQILRGNKPAYNLSEGECNLVSFCYFVAKLEDTDSKGKKLIIYIDDPVSSLDSNHIFFLFSLIETLIARPEEDANGNKVLDADGKPVYRYEQLFISTHNLDFLRYLKRLSRPKKNHEQFLVVGKENSSTLELMPSYLKNYITEFNYLFGEIYTCSDPANAATEYHCFYNFGNNLRKFLEAFLFFKYPFSVNDQQDYNRRIEKFFKDDPSTEPLVQRLTNEFSHLGGIFDRSTQPIDHAEICKLAKFVLKKIKDNDCDQFECLLESIDKPDPFSA
ncbi:MAG: AAA family ATPase [Halobacteriota archaeon]